MSDRDHRRAVIRQLLQDREISSQEELATLLDEKGISCTQATLSRDLRDLGVARIVGAAGPRYRLDPKNRYLEVLRQVVGMEIQNVRHNGMLVVVRTLTGRAEGVAGFLDAWRHPDILGTVAGDDTVLVAPVDTTRTAQLAEAIRALMDGEGGTL